MSEHFFEVFFGCVLGLIICTIYLAFSFSKEQLKLQNPLVKDNMSQQEYEKKMNYRIDQMICSAIAVILFWILLLYSMYVIAAKVLEWIL